ncbi:uncharacterized protein LOC142345699 [Convolutriloba macropyga]|uniref:uncharacterized protein LOC142345699 n=1 Tax=Convolutriloba macropyga TaxID=536237 RepID=UPI003F525C55
MKPTSVKRSQHQRSSIKGNRCNSKRRGHITKRTSRTGGLVLPISTTKASRTSSSSSISVASRARDSQSKSTPTNTNHSSGRTRSPSNSRSPHRTTKVTKHMRKLFLTKIKTIRTKAKMNTCKLFEEITCAVCRFSLQDPYKILPCNHSFCNWCLTEWLKQNATCPMCRCKPTIFRKDREARAKVEFVCGRLSSERQLEMGYGRVLSEQQYCLISHKMKLGEFLNLVPQSAASQREAEARREREYQQYAVQVQLLQNRLQNLRSQQEQLMRRRRRQIDSVRERFESVLEALDHQEELLTMQLEQQQLAVYS